jgi:hypothetical protein
MDFAALKTVDLNRKVEQSAFVKTSAGKNRDSRRRW